MILQMRTRNLPRRAFSLVEVVLALGVISFAIVAILGMVPTALQTGHSAQDETRATQIAQTIFSALASQASTNFTNIQFPLADGSNPNLSASSSPTSPNLYVDNNGKIIATAAGATYAITLSTNATPAGFSPADAGLASQVTVSVAWPASAPATSQIRRDFARIISKY